MEERRRGWGPLRVLGNRNFAYLFAAGGASTAGQGIGGIALTWLVFISTGSALDIAGVAVATFVAAVALSLVAGALVDRHDRRRLMLAADLARAATLAGLTAALVLVGFNLLAVLAVAFLLGAFSTLFGPAERALTPALVGPEQIGEANGLVQTSTSILQFVSNGIGGVVIGLAGVVVALGVNALTFVVSAAFIASISVARAVSHPRSVSGSAPTVSLMSDLSEGVRYLVGQRGLLWLTVSAGFGNFFEAIPLTFMVLYSALVLHAGAGVFGALVGLFALGFGPGSLLVAPTGAVRHAGLVWLGMGIVGGVLLVALALLPVLPVALALTFALGMTFGYGNTTWLTTVQIVVPTEMQGRYFGLDQLGSWAIIPAGQLAGGLLILAWGVPATFAFCGLGIIATFVAFTLSRELRNLSAHPTPAADRALP